MFLVSFASREDRGTLSSPVWAPRRRPDEAGHIAEPDRPHIPSSLDCPGLGLVDGKSVIASTCLSGGRDGSGAPVGALAQLGERLNRIQ